MEKDRMLRGFFLGFVKIHILHHACQEAVYGAQLIAELARHGYELSPGTMYPILHDLERSGYLERENRLVAGKIRKYYRTTGQGEFALAEARLKITELVAEVLEEARSAGEMDSETAGDRRQHPAQPATKSDIG
jgi:PadR family transcriptional regulator, regulatory protein PadR